MKVLAVITARGGSKGIPRKNIKDFLGKPLIAYTIDAAKESTLLQRTIVSTEDEEIARIAKASGGDVPFMRPQELAEDKSPTLPVIQHALQYLQEHDGEVYDYVVTLQPTSPLRTGKDIDDVISKTLAAKADSGVALMEVDAGSHPMKMKKLVGDRVAPYCMEEPEGIRRQDLPPVYKRNGAVYVSKVDNIHHGVFYGEHVVGCVMPKERSVDIDTPKDWEEAEALAKALL